MTSFIYNEAFSRNIGWVTYLEQDVLKNSVVAIAGLGGVGGAHLLSLARLGIGEFRIADFDTYSIPNINRQVGATVKTIGMHKTEVMFDMAKSINPEAKIKVFDNGLTAYNIDKFFKGVDLYVDGLDFFAFEAREMAFAYCAKHHIPAITAAPLGMGTAMLTFMPGRMTFEEYFQLKGQSEADKILRLLVGLSPTLLQAGYLVDESTVDLLNHQGPSTQMACDLCAGVVATQALKILLHRGNVIAAPHGLHFDAYKNKLVKTWRPFGNNNPLQRLVIAMVRRQFMKGR